MNNRAAHLTGFGTSSMIEVRSVEVPLPSSGEVRVKVEASTVSATDIFIRKGIYPLLKKKPPFILGYDFIGRIDYIGEHVEGFKIGDRVCGIVMTGGNADYICCPYPELSRVPEDITASQAACAVLSGITAYQMFTHYAKVKEGDRVLIHGGSGAVGDTLLQLAQLYKCQIVTTASMTKHSSIKSRYGAVVLDYNDKDYWEDIELIAMDGFDAAFDFTNQRSLRTSFHLLKQRGILVTYAVYSSSLKIQKKNFINFITFGIDFGLMMLKLKWWGVFFRSKTACFYGSTDSRNQFPERHQQDMNSLFALIMDKKINPLVHRTMKLEQCAEAHRILESGRVHGQIVIDNSL